MIEIRRLADKSDKWHIDFDEEWITHNGAVRVLREHGYEAAVYRHVNPDTLECVVRYVLYKQPNEIIFETQDQDELNRYINLILPPRS